MAMRPEQLRLSPDERADLVAYLDGELPEAHTRVISTKLTQSATARREVEILKKTWELLDFLPRPKAAPEFSERTISHIQRIELEGHSWEPFVASWSAQAAWAVVYLVAVGVSLGVGYSLTRWVWPDPTARVTRDLTLAEHLDEYLDVGSFEFLSQLAASKEFGPQAP
ncbi:MAG: anti-sigma factor family protein [Isosphaeraceae bacterium]